MRNLSAMLLLLCLAACALPVQPAGSNPSGLSANRNPITGTRAGDN